MLSDWFQYTITLRVGQLSNGWPMLAGGGRALILGPVPRNSQLAWLTCTGVRDILVAHEP